MLKNKTCMMLTAVIVLACCLVFSVSSESRAEEIPEVTITLNRTTADVLKGESITATVDIAGSKDDYNIEAEWSVHEDGRDFSVIWQELGKGKMAVATYKPTFGEAGEVTFYVDGARHSKAFSITGSAEPLMPLSVTLSLDRTSAQVGLPITITATGLGGNAPYEYQFYWTAYTDSGSIPGIRRIGRDENASDTYTPNDLRYIRISTAVTAYDSDGRSALGTIEFDVLPGNVVPENVQIDLSFDKDTVDVSKGESITATATVTGLNEPYEVSIHWNVYEQDQEYWGQASYIRTTRTYVDTFTPLFGDEGYATVIVGSWDYSYSKWFGIDGTVPPEKPVTLQIQINRSPVVSGQTIVAQAQADGGTGPYTFHFRWQGNKNGEYVGTPRYELMGVKENTDSYSPDYDDYDEIELHVFAIDAMGREAFESVVVPVLPSVHKQGDATNDGTIDILDLVSIIDYIVSSTSPASLANADANGDGTVDILDLVWIIDKIVGS